MTSAAKKESTADAVLKKSIFGLAWPIFFQMLLGVALGYVDTIMLSNYSETAVGAIGNSNSVLGFLALAFLVISSATGIIVSQYLGANKKEEMNKIYTVAISFNLALSVVISAVIFLFSTPLLELMQVPDEMMRDADLYMKIVGGTIFTQAMINAFSQIFNSNGKTIFGMIISFAMNIINIIGNYLFLYGPLSNLGLGAAGAAVSTSVSRFLCMIAAIIYFAVVIKGRVKIKYLIPFPKKILSNMLKLGIPSAGENFSYECTQLVITAMVNTMGIVAINTRIYANMLATVAYMIAYSAGVATQIQVGHSVGAGDYDYASKRVLKTLRFGLAVSISLAIVNWLVAPYTFQIFSHDSAVAALGTTIMFIAVFLECGRTTNLIVITSMKAAGDVKFPTVLAIFSMWGFSVLLSFVLGIVLGMGLAGIWIGMALDEIFRGIVVFIRWKKGSWKGKQIINSHA